MLFDWLVTGQVVPMNPAAAVRGPKHVVKTGSTPVLDGMEWQKLLDAIPTETVRDLRDRALIVDDAGVPFRYQNVLLAKLAPMEKDIVTKP